MTTDPSEPNTPERTASAAGSFLILCGVGLCAILSSTMSKTPVLPLFAHNYLQVSDSVLGFIAAASTVVGIVVSLPAGALSDIFGRRAVLLSALFVFASAPVLYLFVHSASALVGVRLYHGLATAIFGPVALAYVADLTRARRAERMGWYSSATLVGRSVAPLLGGLLISLGPRLGGPVAGYHAVYLACAAAGIAALALGFLLPRARPAAAGGAEVETVCTSPTPAECLRQMGDGLAAVGRSRPILVTGLTEALQYLAFGAVETFLPLYAKSRGVSELQIGIIFGAQIVTLALTKPLSGRQSDRLGRRAVIVTGLALNAVSLVALTLYPTFWGFLVGGTLFGLAMSVVTASTSALVADVSRARHYGTSLGVLSTIMDVGHAGGPILAGMLIPLLAYAGTYRLLAAVMLVAMAGFALATTGLAREISGEAADAEPSQ